MQRSTMKTWFLVHKWTSLVCTLFLLLLCLTGLPLIFYEEINHLTGAEPEVSAPQPGAKPINLDVLSHRRWRSIRATCLYSWAGMTTPPPSM